MQKECECIMFGKLKNLFSQPGITIASPVSGTVVPLTEVPDPTFAQGILGPGAAVQPSEGRIVAPANGTVDMMFDTGHAVSMTTSEGAELLIHVGIDTVSLKGQHYTAKCKSGDTVRKGGLRGRNAGHRLQPRCLRFGQDRGRGRNSGRRYPADTGKEIKRRYFTMKTFEYTITDELGIHARPAGMLVKEASKFASKIMIASPKKEVDAKRIMGVMSMGAKKGDTVKLTIEGADEAEAAASLEKFLQDNL